jgi:hypothetical protein
VRGCVAAVPIPARRVKERVPCGTLRPGPSGPVRGRRRNLRLGAGAESCSGGCKALRQIGTFGSQERRSKKHLHQSQTPDSSAWSCFRQYYLVETVPSAPGRYPHQRGEFEFENMIIKSFEAGSLSCVAPKQYSFENDSVWVSLRLRWQERASSELIPPHGAPLGHFALNPRYSVQLVLRTWTKRRGFS